MVGEHANSTQQRLDVHQGYRELQGFNDMHFHCTKLTLVSQVLLLGELFAGAPIIGWVRTQYFCSKMLWRTSCTLMQLVKIGVRKIK